MTKAPGGGGGRGWGGLTIYGPGACITGQGILFIRQIHDRVSNSCFPPQKKILQNRAESLAILKIMSSSNKLFQKRIVRESQNFEISEIGF